MYSVQIIKYLYSRVLRLQRNDQMSYYYVVFVLG